MTRMRKLRRSTWREHFHSSPVFVIYHSLFASIAITIGNISHQSATSVGRILALQTCASSLQMHHGTIFHPLLNHPLNSQARRVRVQAQALLPSFPLSPSRRRNRFHDRGGAPGCSDSPRLRPPQSLRWWRHRRQLIYLSQVRDQCHLWDYRRYRRVYTRASASTTVLRNVRSMSHLGHPRCLRRVRAPRSARGAGQCAGSQPCRVTRTQIWTQM